MVDSIKAVDGATKSKAAEEVKAVKNTDKVEKQEETKAKKTEQKEQTDKVAVRSSYAYDRITIQNKVKEYIENLKKTHDYPSVIEELTKYLDLFKVDDFMKKYPNITTEAEFKTIMYNETIKYL
ncbi:hypothetical protein IKE67_01215 [bacterium]|nr:hypothetical protein [bacterium]